MTIEQEEQSELLKTSQIQNFTNYLALFPNPAKDFVVVKYNFISNNFLTGNIIITDNTGKTVRTETITTNTGQQTISISELSNGTYNISIQSNGEILGTETLVIEQIK